MNIFFEIQSTHREPDAGVKATKKPVQQTQQECLNDVMEGWPPACHLMFGYAIGSYCCCPAGVIVPHCQYLADIYADVER